jgi:hypothetical protein
MSRLGTACIDKLKSMKKIYGHHAFHFVEGISKVGHEQFVFANKIMRNSQCATQKLQYREKIKAHSHAKC